MNKSLEIIVLAFVMFYVAPAVMADHQGACTNDTGCGKGHDCGSMTLTNENCKSGVWPFEKDEVRVHVWDMSSAKTGCTDKWVEVKKGSSKKVPLRACGEEGNWCDYYSELEATTSVLTGVPVSGAEHSSLRCSTYSGSGCSCVRF